MAGDARGPDFDAIAAAALDAAARLVPAWLPGGKRRGHEYVCGDLAGGEGDSCSVNLTTGAWADFAGDERGGDLISLYAAVRGIKQGAAARELAAELGVTHTPRGPLASGQSPPPRGSAGTPRAPSSERRAKPAGEHSARAPGRKAATARGATHEQAVAADEPLAHVDEAAAWHDAGAWPPDGPPAPAAHPFRGRPQASWAYHDAAGHVLGYVHRFATSAGGKEILPCVWSCHAQHGTAWKWRAFDEPRPLYGLPRLGAGERKVLLVEGEKCADAAHELLGDRLAVLTWPGGAKAWRKADWQPLAGRKVILWPDADSQRQKLSPAQKRAGVDPLSLPLLPAQKQPGVAAMLGIAGELAALGCEVRLVDVPAPGEALDGWDVADLIAEAGAEARDRVLAQLRRLLPVDAAPAQPPANPHGAALAGGGDDCPPPADGPGWQSALAWERGALVKHPANIITILRNDPRWHGVVGFDEFAQVTVKRGFPPYGFARLGEWEAEDDTRTAAWLAQHWALYVSSAQVTEAVETVARERRFHPVVEHLRGLRWDGERRLKRWLQTYLGVPDSLYTRAVGRYFLRGMVRRVMEPGCKFDYCLVLEGTEGLRKSTFALALGGAWGSDVPLDLANNREAANAIHGRWVIEFSEMESVTRAEAHLQKSFLSRQFDQYRPVYSRRNIKVPRQCVFVGTTNEDEYIKEGQGARRFWPLAIGGTIRIEALRAALPQLLAEAVVDHDAGARSHPREREQRLVFRPEQMRRVQQESLIDALHDWVLDPGIDELAQRGVNDGAFSLADAAFRCLKVSYAQLTRDLQTRVGKALAALGCERVEKRNGMTRYWYRPPAKKAASSSARQPAQRQPGDDDDIPF